MAEFCRTMWVRNDAAQHLGLPFLLWFENHSLRQFLARRSSNREMCAQARTATCLLPKTLPQYSSQEHIRPLDCVWRSLAASMGRMEDLV